MRRILAIGAHPDDVEFGCGGTLLNHRRRGDEVVVLTLTHGERGGTPEVRAAEARRSAERLGAILELLAFPDAALPNDVHTVEAIERVVRSFRPTDVYTHSAHDTHQDHRAAHAATIVAARGVANLSSYQSPSATADFRPVRFVDIADVLNAKLDLIGAHASQLRRRGAFDPEYVAATARYWGRFAGYGCVEPFEVIRQIERS